MKRPVVDEEGSKTLWIDVWVDIFNCLNSAHGAADLGHVMTKFMLVPSAGLERSDVGVLQEKSSVFAGGAIVPFEELFTVPAAGWPDLPEPGPVPELKIPCEILSPKLLKQILWEIEKGLFQKEWEIMTNMPTPNVVNLGLYIRVAAEGEKVDKGEKAPMVRLQAGPGDADKIDLKKLDG
ncbi:unnamed protein product, partial [Prorocentrum cordatum]